MKPRRVNPLAGPLPRVLDPLAWAASRAYRSAVDRRNREFDAGVGVERLPLPVISVGNISAGGTGKTPLVMYLVRLLQQNSRTPIIAMRGYKATRGGESDEEAEYRQRLPGVTVLANPRRYETVRSHLAQGGPGDCVLLDDGFQHRALGRNLDMVVIDATRPFMLDRLLPAGYLREPAESLGRADAVVISRSHQLGDTERQAVARAVEQCHGRPPVAWSVPRWTSLEWTDADGDRQTAIEALAGLRVLSVCGIGNPAAFNDQVRTAGAEIVELISLRDHHPFPRRLVERLLVRSREVRAQAVVTTAKDWTKLRQRRPESGWPLPMLRPVLEICMREGESTLRRLVLDAVQGNP